jgi:para-aminobenzoate synthetase component I
MPGMTPETAFRPFVREIVYAEPFLLARRLKGQAGLTLFESALRHEHLGRYSFLAARPSSTIIVQEPDQGAALHRIAAFLTTHRRLHVDGLPPFQGGLAGYVSYDYGAGLEPKAKIARRGGPAPLLIMHAFGTVVSFDHLQERAWIVSDAEQEADALEQLMSRKAEPLGRHGADTFLPRWTRASHEAAVARTVEYILAGDIFQANITQALTANVAEGFDAFALYGNLRHRNAAPFMALLDCDGITIVSSSPERLVSFDGTKAETRPIKGTRRRDGDASRDAALVADLLSSRKDRAENVMIVDLLRNDLSRVCKPGTVRVPVLCGLESYANVHHLVSAVTGELRDGLDQVDLFRAVFPGGSITGAPKIRAMEIIDELEGRARGVYCGAIGYFGFNGRCDFNIAIRTVEIADGVATLQGGGGITARSQPAAEYDESLIKVQRILEAFTA